MKTKIIFTKGSAITQGMDARQSTGLSLSYSRIPEGEIPYLYFPKLRDIKNADGTGFVKHLLSTRYGGVSTGMFASMNFNLSLGDDPDNVLENYRRIACILGTECGRFVLSRQTHKVNIRRVGEQDAGKGVIRERDYDDVDGLITDVPELVLGVFGADCVPMLFADPVHRAVGAAHAGWRGTAGRIAERVIEAMRENFGTEPSDLVVGIGASICRECYEVSQDVAEVFASSFTAYTNEILIDDGINAAGEHKYHLDLWQANRRVLLENGVRDENIALPGICTNCNPDLLFSHRFTKGKRGVNGVFIAMQKERKQETESGEGSGNSNS